MDGPLQDDAVLAVGRIGDPTSLGTIQRLDRSPATVAAAADAARCLLGDDCPARIAALAQVLSALTSSADAVRAAAAALGALASKSDAALSELAAVAVGTSGPPEAAAAFGGLALRSPGRVLAF